jgi:hypothetical protein
MNFDDSLRGLRNQASWTSAPYFDQKRLQTLEQSTRARFWPSGPVGMRILLQEIVEFINPFPDADDGGVPRALGNVRSRPHFTGFKKLKLPLKLRTHFDPFFNKIMDYRHAIPPMFRQQLNTRSGRAANESQMAPNSA